MQEFDVVGRIQELCRSRSWTYYRLAKASGIPYSTLSTMLRKTNVPSLPSLMKICDGFDITLSQFFANQDETALLTEDQKDCLSIWNNLDNISKSLTMAYMQALKDRQSVDVHKK